MHARRSLPLLTLALVVSLPLLSLSGVASAKKAPGVNCVKHPNRAKCLNTGGGTGTGPGTGGTSAITVQIDPQPLVETGPSEVAAVIQVETSASFADDPVDISSSQLEAACGGIIAFQNATTVGLNTVQLFLDNDGNAAVVVEGTNCAPGSDIIEADLAVAPFITALGPMMVSPPGVTASGVFGSPSTSGIVTTGEVETGDTAESGDSDVLGIFYVETDPVYAEQPVTINSPQLIDRCLTGGIFTTPLGDPFPAVLDDDGNAVFIFFGSSCAAGPSAVIADILAGTNTTYTTTFTIDAPQVTI